MLPKQHGKPFIRKGRYIRIAVFPINKILPFVFTRDVRHKLKKTGRNYRSREWIAASRRKFKISVKGKTYTVKVPMGSHRYQLFATKGVKCISCGLEGTYFALERGARDNANKFHLNLYARTKDGREVMITKDHIIPRSKGGKNRLSNYQPLCFVCNQKKADKVIYDKGVHRKRNRSNSVRL